MFHRFRVPDWMSEYFGLPPVQHPGSETLQWPVFVSLPMGFSFSVAIAIAAHHPVVDRTLSSIPFSSQLHSNKVVVLADLPSTDLHRRLVFFDYVDDHAVISCNPNTTNQALESSLGALNDIGLVANPNKIEWSVPPFDDKEVLGLAFSANGIVHPKFKFLTKVSAITSSVLNLQKITSAQLLSLIGHWTWALLLKRPLLSVFQDVYVPLDLVPPQCSVDICPHDSFAKELGHALALAPLLTLNLKLPFSPTILFCSSTHKEATTLSAYVPPHLALQLASLHFTSGWCSSLSLTTLPPADAFDPPSRSHVDLSLGNPQGTDFLAPDLYSEFSATLRLLLAQVMWSLSFLDCWRNLDEMAILELKLTPFCWASVGL